MNEPQPLVTVLMPVYNGEKYLCDAIESILGQTYTNFIFLIINDGSTDTSEEIILSYKDIRIQYEKNEVNLGIIASLNKGFSLARTKYVARMDADDISVSDRLQRQVVYMENNFTIGVLGSWFQSFNDTGILGITKYEEDHQNIVFKHLYQMHLCHPSCMIRQSVIEQEKPLFDTNYIHAEDYDLFTRLSHNTKLANLPIVLLKLRKHNNEVSCIYRDEQKENSLKIKKREFEKLGFKNLQDEQIADFGRLNYQEYHSITSSPIVIKTFLENMIDHNQETNYFSEIYLFNKLSSLWFNYCYETHLSISEYKSSFLCRNEFLTISRRIKWYIKTIQHV